MEDSGHNILMAGPPGSGICPATQPTGGDCDDKQQERN